MFDSLCMAILFLRYALLFIDHFNGMHRADLRADTATFAVFHIYGYRDGFGHHSFGAVKPAQETGGLAGTCGDAFAVIYDRYKDPPLACPAGLADAG
jgi:hypothetical protein